MNNFISANNTYIFDSIDITNKSICLKVNGDYITFNWKGDVEEFYNDVDDLLGNVVCYKDNIELEPINLFTNGDVGYVGDFVIEHIVQMMYNSRYV